MRAVTDATIVFERTIGGERLIVALNLGGDAQPLPPFVQGAGIVLSTMMDRGGRIEEATLRGDEGLVLRPPA